MNGLNLAAPASTVPLWNVSRIMTGYTSKFSVMDSIALHFTHQSTIRCGCYNSESSVVLSRTGPELAQESLELTQNLRRTREDQRTREYCRTLRVQLQYKLGDHTKVAAAAANSIKQIWIRRRRRFDYLARGSYDCGLRAGFIVNNRRKLL